MSEIHLHTTCHFGVIGFSGIISSNVLIKKEDTSSQCLNLIFLTSAITGIQEKEVLRVGALPSMRTTLVVLAGG
jgi:hypothetical protein